MPKSPLAKAASPTLQPLIGHRSILDFLGQAQEKGRLAHAYLFVGPANVGKTALALEFAQQVLATGKPAQHPDFLLVERGADAKTGKPHKEIVIDQIQRLRGWLTMGALAGGWKVAVIDRADQLNEAAANALLKSLEEPKEQTLLLLTAVAANQVFPTIRSRCQIVTFGRVPTPEIQAAVERLGLPATRAELVARLAQGCPGQALTWARDAEALAARLAVREEIMTLLEAGVADRFQAVGRILPAKVPFNEAGERVGLWLDAAAEICRDLWHSVQGLDDQLVNVDLKPRLRDLATRFGSDRAVAALEGIGSARELVGQNVSPRAVLENFLISF